MWRLRLFRRGLRLINLLFLAPYSSYRIAPYVQAAQRLGHRVFLASQSQFSLTAASVVGISIPIRDAEASVAVLKSALADHPIHGVIVTDDALMDIGALIANHFHLPCNDLAAARFARRKDLARDCLRQAGIPVPDFQLYALAAADVLPPQIAFPLVIKPLSLSASRGVIRVNDQAEFHQAVVRVQAIVQDLPNAFEASHLLLEAYIEGEEFALEGILEIGQLRLLTIFDKPDPMVGPFFEETIYLTPSRLSEEKQQFALSRLQQVCEAYGLVEGPVHAEFRLDANGELWVIDVAARTIGGQCGQVLEYGLGICIEDLVIANKLGIALDLPANQGAAGVMMIPIPERGVLKRVEGILAAMAVPLVEDIQMMIPVGFELIPLPEGNHYLGFIFAKGENAQEVEEAIRLAYSHLRFVISPSLPVRIG